MNLDFSHRLDGLEADNLLAFLSLLGLLRALEADDQGRMEEERLRPRVMWDVDRPPFRPRLVLARDVDRAGVLERAAGGLESLASVHEFGARKDLNYSREQCRELLEVAARTAASGNRARIDLLASLMSDAAIKDDKEESIDPTPLCLLFGQGHQHFLERLSEVPRELAPPTRGRGKSGVSVSAAECLGEALFEPWHRADATSSFRWDPEEAVRYALMAGDPTDPAYKSGTQHGANRLAAVGLGVLTLVPETRAGRVRPSIVGGTSSAAGFSFTWPIWREPATLAAIRALLAHSDLRKPGALAHLGVVEVVTTQRISVGKFMNFTRARPPVTNSPDLAPEPL